MLYDKCDLPLKWQSKSIKRCSGKVIIKLVAIYIMQWCRPVLDLQHIKYHVGILVYILHTVKLLVSS